MIPTNFTQIIASLGKKIIMKSEVEVIYCTKLNKVDSFPPHRYKNDRGYTIPEKEQFK